MKLLTFVVATFAVSSLLADWNLSPFSGWRVIGGANYNSNLKTELNVSGRRALPYMSSPVRPNGASKAGSEASSQVIANGGRVEFPDGAYIDPDYAGKGMMPDYVYKSSGEIYRRIDTVENGSYITSVEMDQAMADWAQNPDGSYGAGTYDGPGAMLPLSQGGQSAFSFSSKVNSISTTTQSMYLNSSADYEEIELTVTAKPYYDITDYFRIVGTLGVVVSRGALDFDMATSSDSRRLYSDSERFHQWDCYGVGGLGGMFHHGHVCLGFDFLARFLDSDIEIDGRNVRGTIERNSWMIRVYAGFEF